MKKLYLVRHGESEWNKLFKIQGQKDICLTNKGKSQAEKIAKRLTNEKIDIIYCSDLKRAYQTAEIIGNKINVKVIPSKGLREIKFGKWEGLSIKELHAQYTEEHLTWIKEPHKFKMEGVETLLQLQNRAFNTLKKCFEIYPDKNILIVSHSATIKTIILKLLNMDISCYNKMSLSNVSLSILEFRDYNIVLKLLNDTCHLRED